MPFSFDQVIIWIIVGLLGGSIAGLIVKGERRGFGVRSNLVIGLAGALIGGALFRLANIWPSLDNISISLRDVVASVLGSLLVLVALWFWRR